MKAWLKRSMPRGTIRAARRVRMSLGQMQAGRMLPRDDQRCAGSRPGARTTPPALRTISVSSFNLRKVSDLCYWKVLDGFVDGPLSDLETLTEWALENRQGVYPLKLLAGLLAQSDDPETLRRCAELCSRGMRAASERQACSTLAFIAANCLSRLGNTRFEYAELERNLRNMKPVEQFSLEANYLVRDAGSRDIVYPLLNVVEGFRRTEALHVLRDDGADISELDDLADFEIFVFCGPGCAPADRERWLKAAGREGIRFSLVVMEELSDAVGEDGRESWWLERVPASCNTLVGVKQVAERLERTHRPYALFIRPERIPNPALFREARRQFSRHKDWSFLQFRELPVDAQGRSRVGVTGDVVRTSRGGVFARVPQVLALGFLSDCFYLDGFDELVARARCTFGGAAIGSLRGPTMLCNEPGNPFQEAPVPGRVDFATLRRCWQAWHVHGDALQWGAASEDSATTALAGLRLHRRRFDVIVASEYRLAGGGPHSCMCEIRALAAAGLRVGILQLDAVTYSNYRNFDRNFAHEVVEEGVAEPVVHPDQARCDLLIVRYPAVFAERCLKGFPIEADDVRIVVNAPPVRHEGGEEFYSVAACVPVIRERTGCDATWHPVGPDARAAMVPYAGIVSLADEDWPAVVDMEVFSGEPRCCSGDAPIIGRHGRDHWTKWPGTREDLAAAYAVNRDGVQVRILGGAKRAIEVLGGQPDNWEVLAYGDMSASDFLRSIDFFVYFPNETRIEPFARSILEALAAGVVAILPERYREIYGDAAVYCEPEQVVPVAQRLFEAPDAHAEQRARGLTFVRARHGPDGFARFVRDIISSRKRARPASRPGHEIGIPQSGQS